MEGRTTNASGGASNNKKPVPSTKGKKEIGTKTNVDIAQDLERFAGEGKTVAVYHGMAEFKHSTKGEVEAAASSGADSTGNGNGGASKLGPTGKIDTGMLFIALQSGEVATISVREEKNKEEESTEQEKEGRD